MGGPLTVLAHSTSGIATIASKRTAPGPLTNEKRSRSNHRLFVARLSNQDEVVLAKGMEDFLDSTPFDLNIRRIISNSCDADLMLRTKSWV